MGTPKALVDDWLVSSVEALRQGGCTEVVVVLGAGAQSAQVLLTGRPVTTIFAEQWAAGMGASLRAGLHALTAAPTQQARPAPEAALVTLVDLPDVGADVVRRLLAAPAGAATLRRAAYDGVPGHPVLLGRDHWSGVAETAVGDRGARAYLVDRDVELVECGDLATGRDVDSR